MKKKRKADSPTLTEVLKGLGCRHVARGHSSLSGRMVLKGDCIVFEGTAHACWEWLRTTGQYPKKTRRRKS